MARRSKAEKRAEQLLSEEQAHEINGNIARSYVALQGAKKAKQELHRTHNEKLAECQETLKQRIEADEDSNEEAAARHKLDGITTAWQELEEAKAAKAADLHEAISECEKWEKQLRDAVSNARQLSLFGLEPERPAPADVQPAADGGIRALKKQASALGIKGYGRMTKDELVHAIAQAGQSPGAVKDDEEGETDGEETEDPEEPPAASAPPNLRLVE